MNTYITQYIIPVLVIMAVLNAAAWKYRGGAKRRFVALISLGFLLGWASAFVSLGFFHLYK